MTPSTDRSRAHRHRSRFTSRDVTHLLDSAAKYTRFVLLSKFFLGLFALGVLALIIALPMLDGEDSGLRLVLANGDARNTSVPVMKNPRFQGVDEKNQPFLVTASTAVQYDANTIILDKVQADMLTDQKDWISVKATTGSLNNNAKQLQLKEDVRLFHQHGYEFRTALVNIDMNQQIARGTMEINGFGPMGTIRANAFEWMHAKKSLKFVGNVNMIIVPERAKARGG